MQIADLPIRRLLTALPLPFHCPASISVFVLDLSGLDFLIPCLRSARLSFLQTLSSFLTLRLASCNMTATVIWILEPIGH